MENPQQAAPGWHPRLVGDISVSFTNSIAVSPTDAMPLSGWAKLLMLSESVVSAISNLLDTARPVNIFTQEAVELHAHRLLLLEMTKKRSATLTGVPLLRWVGATMKQSAFPR